MKARAADQRDVEAWAEIVKNTLFRAHPDRRAEILALAVQNEEAARRDRAANGPFKIRGFADIDLNTPGHRHCHVILRLKSLLVQVFVRDVTNTNSPAEAVDLLFAHQRFGTDRAAFPSIWS